MASVERMCAMSGGMFFRRQVATSFGRESDVGRALEEEVFHRLRHIAFVAESVGVDLEFVEVLVEAAVASS